MFNKYPITKQEMLMTLDAVVFAAHPDDAELSMGGTIAKLTSQGLKVGIIDLTKGELGTRGSAETRQKEAFQAAITLKIAVRDNLLLPDGGIEISKENVTKIIMVLRKYKPKIIFAPYFNDRHPDHIDTSKLVKKALFYSGLSKIKTFDKEIAQNAFRPSRLYYYMQTYQFEPSFIVDISEYFETKMKAIKAYQTQFYDPKSVEPETFISQPNFMKYVESRAQMYGFKIGKNYGEPFYCEESIELDFNKMIFSKKEEPHSKDFHHLKENEHKDSLQKNHLHEHYKKENHIAESLKKNSHSVGELQN